MKAPRQCEVWTKSLRSWVQTYGTAEDDDAALLVEDLVAENQMLQARVDDPAQKFEDAQNRYTHLLDVYLDAISAVRKVALLQNGDVNGSAENSDPA